jgi:hypothetical protein
LHNDNTVVLLSEFRSRWLQARRRAPSAVFAVHGLALVIDALRSRFRAICEHVQQLRELGVAVLFHEPGDVVAAAPPAGFALDREGVGVEVRERVRVLSHALGRPSLPGPRPYQFLRSRHTSGRRCSPVSM